MQIEKKQPSHWCEAVYEARAAELVLYGRALGLSHGEAEDVLQDTFLALMDRPRPARNAEYYCVRAFRNRALNYRRGLFRRFLRELEAKRWFEKDPGETAEERAAMKHLAALPVNQREVIILKIWHRYTFARIGQLLGESPHTVAGRYRYGIRKLQHALQRKNHERLELIRTAPARLEAPAAG